MTSVYECDNNNISENEEHLNFMAGVSYFPKDPILELKLVLLSSFLGEQKYYNPTTDKDINFNN